MRFMTLGRIVSALFASTCIVGFAPVSLSLKSNSNCIEFQGEKAKFERIGVAESTDLVITNLSNEEIVLLGFELDWPQVFSENLIRSAPSNAGTPSSPQFALAHSESIMVAGVFGDLGFTAEGEKPAALTVSRNSKLSRYEFEGRHQIDSRASKSICSQTNPLLLQMFNHQVGKVDQIKGSISIGQESISSDALIKNPKFKILLLGMQNYLRGLLIILAVVSVFAVIGFIVLAAKREPIEDLRELVFGMNSVLFIALLPISAMSYFFPISQIINVVLILGLLVVGLLLRRKSSSLRLSRDALCNLNIKYGCGLLAVSFLPIFYFGTTYAGQYNTDLFDNGRLISLLRNHSLFEMQNLPEAINAGVMTSGAGITWRTIDSAAAAVMSELFYVKSIGGYLIFAMVGYVSFILTVFSLSSRSHLEHKFHKLMLIGAVSPFFIGLFLENYYAQFLFVAFAPATILSISQFFEFREITTRIGKKRMLYMAASVTFSLCLYPYFAVVLYGPLLIFIFFRSGFKKKTLIDFGFFSALVFVLSNLHLIPIFNFREGLSYTPFLNELTKHTLLGPFKGGEMIQLLLGLQPFQLRVLSYPNNVPGSAFFDFLIFSDRLLNNFRLLFYILAIILVCVVFYTLLKKSVEGLIIKVALGSWVIYILVLGALESTYAEFKAIWTLLALLPILFSQTFKHQFNKWLVALLVPFAIFWSLTTLADQSSWFMNPKSRIVAKEHMTIYEDLYEVGRIIESSNEEITFVQGDEPLQGSDRDRVLLQHLLIFVEDNGGISKIEMNAEQFLRDKGVLYVSIGRMGANRLQGMSVLYDGLHVQVFLTDQ
jgi:hypothetical protein